MKNPNVFLSYTWEDEAHREWVRALATQLRADGVETILDCWHAVPGDQLPQFMESAVRDADYVLIVCTPYKHKSNNRKGGVGYEGDIRTGEVFVSGNRRRFVPILRKGPWEKAAPSWLRGTYYIDFSNDAQFQNSYRHLADTLLGKALPAPPVAVVRFARNQDGTVTDTKTNLMWGMPSDEQEYPFSKVFTPGAGTMEKGPWNQETINEKSSGSSPFYNPSYTPNYALQAMAESSTQLLRPVRQASDEEA
jgi:hypothetical protein